MGRRAVGVIDNGRVGAEAGNGDHIHLGKKAFPCVFVDPDQLVADFMNHVTEVLDEHRHV
jgi:hypothetical protein